MHFLRILTATFVTALLAGSALAAPRHGIAMHGEPALSADFKNLPYVNPEAPQGGMLRQAISGSFDSVNPFIIKGTAAFNVRTLVFESLMGRNWDEPFSLYGLLAESIDVTDDRATFTFKIRPEAKFSDGSPVTAADVVWSMETLRDKGRPNFKNSYSKVKSVETPDDHTVVFRQDGGDRELPLIVGVMPVLSKKNWEGKAFDTTTLDKVVGSGPYVISEIKAGERITYTKNPDYWGKALPLNKGLWNFDSLRYDYFRDANAAFEALKKGDADVRIETDPVRWSSGYDFPAVSEGKLIKETVEQRSPAPASGFAFNTRRKIFEDVRVREALSMAFDFEWANANLFSKAYRRTFGYYSGSMLSSKGKPADARELAIIGEGGLRADYLDGSYALPVSDGSGRDRKVLRAAVGKLADAGWTIKDGAMVNAAGEPFAFTLTLGNGDQEKIALHFQRTLQQIGIKVDVRLVDAAQFASLQKTYDYDMIPVTWYNSLSPGNEQKLYFGSAGRTAEGTRNYPGIADSKVDAAIDAMLKATTQEDFESAVRAEDRLLVAGHYIIPLYDAGGQWVARWTSIGRPPTQPLPGFEATTLWRVQ
ncbi:MAG: ABC transporter substrate-binding protein [Rhizobiales bacterium]|nr:ABC transporter substrate-binding protein [Hyphomicrobiales bacterium]